jgi:hypothetical protein
MQRCNNPFREFAMWICSKCGENVEDDFEVCWSCGAARDGTPNPEFVPEQEGVVGDQAYQVLQSAQREENLITVATFGNAPEAHMVRSRLEAEGIHAFVMDDLAATTWGLVNSMDGVQLQVPEKDAARARDVLKDIHHTPIPETDEEEAEHEEHIQADRNAIGSQTPLEDEEKERS